MLGNAYSKPVPLADVPPGLEPGGRPMFGGRTIKKDEDRKGRLMASPSGVRCPGLGLSTWIVTPEGDYG
jgi:hypothetical protein